MTPTDRVRKLQSADLHDMIHQVANKGRQLQSRRGKVYFYNGNFTWQVLLDGDLFPLPDCRRQKTTDFWHEDDIVSVQRIGKLDIITGFAAGG